MTMDLNRVAQGSFDRPQSMFARASGYQESVARDSYTGSALRSSIHTSDSEAMERILVNEKVRLIANVQSQPSSTELDSLIKQSQSTDN